MQYPAETMVMQHPYYHQMIPHQRFPPHAFFSMKFLLDRSKKNKIIIPYPLIPHHRYQSHQGSSFEENRTIWVGDLHYWMEEKYLQSCFAHTGEVTSIKVIRNKQTGQPQGFGFVEFYTRAAVEKVLQTYNGTAMPIAEKPFRLNWASFRMGDRRCSDHSIFVGDVPSDTTYNLLRETFASSYPSVEGEEIATDASTGSSKGYDSVRFNDNNERTQEITEMNGVYCSSRRMHVGVVKPRKSTGIQQMSSQGIL
ncbi:hypothetical protein MKX03_016699 [Papaver bracteatum]|nr:hypothetical protein MKX03_016699 [Papaver bracteatum]